MDTISIDVIATLTSNGGKTYDLRAGSYIVGSASCENLHDIPVDDPSLDIKHAALFVSQNGSVQLMDFLSKHGTYIDGKKLNTFEIANVTKSAKLQFGSVVFHFRSYHESDSGILGLNETTDNNTSIIPGTPPKPNESQTRRLNKTSTTKVSLDNNASANDESFFAPPTQAAVASIRSKNTGANVQINGSLLDEDDDFFIPETQEIVPTRKQFVEESDSFDMFQLNTQDFQDANDCSNDSDNLIANCSDNNIHSMNIPYISPGNKIHAEKSHIEIESNTARPSVQNENDESNDTDCDEELLNMNLEQTSKTANELPISNNDDMGSACTTPDLNIEQNVGDEILPTQVFPGLSSVRKENESPDEDSPTNLDKTQMFIMPCASKNASVAHLESAGISTENLEATQLFQPVVQSVSKPSSPFSLPSLAQFNRIKNSARKSSNIQETNENSIEPTQVFRPPSAHQKPVNEIPPELEDTIDLEPTQKFIVPSKTINNKENSPSPVLLDSDEEANDDDFCFAATLVVDDQPKTTVASSSKSIDEVAKRKSQLNKLFGSDNEDEDDNHISPVSVITPARPKPAGKQDISHYQPTPDFAFIKLPNINKLNVADELFRSKSKNFQRQKTLLEESSDEDDDDSPTKAMDRLLTESEKLPTTRTTSSEPKATVEQQARRVGRAKSTSTTDTKNSKDTKGQKTASKRSRTAKVLEEKEEPKSKIIRKAREKPESTSSRKPESKPRSTTSNKDSKPMPESKDTRKRQDHSTKEVVEQVTGDRNVNADKSSKSNKRNIENHSTDKDSGKRRARREEKTASETKNTSSETRKTTNKNLGESDDISRSESRNCKVLIHRCMLDNFPDEKQRETSTKRQKTEKDETDAAKKRSKENDPPLKHAVTEEHASNQVRKSNRSVKPRIIFTKMDSKPYAETIDRCGCSIVSNPIDCNILVTDAIYRTWKFLSAMAKGVPIVTVDWIQHASTCRDNKQQLSDTDNYLIKDSSSEKRFKFTLKKSLERARHSPVFKGYTFYCTPNTKPVPKELQTIIECAGGKVIKKIQKDFERPDHFYVISDKSDISMWPTIRGTVGDVSIISTEAIIIGVMQQCINFKSYLLSK